MLELTGRLTMTVEQIEAFGRLTEAASRGDGAAACTLGDMYREGLGGLRYSSKLTFRWYSCSAMAGDANGRNNLGACYEHGLGCAQSYPKAVKWYRLSAAQDLGTASMNLGCCHLRVEFPRFRGYIVTCASHGLRSPLGCRRLDGDDVGLDCRTTRCSRTLPRPRVPGSCISAS